MSGKWMINKGSNMEEKSNVTIVVTGGNNQIQPNVTTGIQINYGSGNMGDDSNNPLKTYIADDETRKRYLARLATCPDVPTLCKTVLLDMYDEVIKDLPEPEETIKSKTFINAIMPLLVMIKSGKTVPNIRNYIHKYILDALKM